MTRAQDKLLEAFLDDLGSAPVPPGLARSVTRRIRDERPVRSSRFVPWMAAAAVIVIVAGFAAMSVAGPAPSPTPSPSVSPTPGESPGASPTPGVPAGEWRITIDSADPPVALSLLVVDHSGGMAGVAQATVTPWPEPSGPYALGIGPGVDDRSVTVSWVGGGCDERAQLELGADGRTLTLRYPPRPSCDAVGIGFAVQLRFAAPVDPAGLAGTWTEDQVSPADVRPAVLAFDGPRDGFVPGTAPGW